MRITDSRTGVVSLILLVLLIFGLVLGVFVGDVSISISDVFQSSENYNKEHSFIGNVVLSYRLAAVFTAALAGASLGLAGLVMQAVFRNPLADPAVLGVSGGASLMVALSGMLISGIGGGLGYVSVTLPAIVGSLGVLLLIMAVNNLISNNIIVLLIGVFIGYITSSVIGVLQVLASKDALRNYMMWGMGSFSAAGWSEIAGIGLILVISVLLILLLSNQLDALVLGDEVAASLGVVPRAVRGWALLVVALLTGVVTATCGPIAFIGISAPYFSFIITRQSRFKSTLPVVMLLGGFFAVICEIIARLPGYPGVLPVNIVTSVIGGPLVVWILIKNRKLL